MAELNYNYRAIVPDVPRAIETEQLHVYVPIGSTNTSGTFRVDNTEFYVDNDGTLHIARPIAEVVEDGGNLGVGVAFTKVDNKPALKFVFQNIKGEQGSQGEQGNKGDTGLDALIYTSIFGISNPPSLNYTVTTLSPVSFSRTPIVDDTSILIWDDYAHSKIYFTIIKILSVSTVVTAQVISFVDITGATGSQGPTGPQGTPGEDGEPGADGKDGVGIASVTQVGVTGGTQVTITLTNGQSTSFVVYNGVNTEFEIVQTLPATGETNIIYLVPNGTSTVENIYDEFIYINGDWEQIGSTQIDLSDYVTKTYFDQNVGTATRNYINTVFTKVQNFYIEMYESGSVPEKDQALTLTNSNFARVPAADQYFALMEVVNTIDVYYTICKILSVDTTTCSAKVIATTEITNGTELNKKADKEDLDGKLDKVTGASSLVQAYGKLANGTQTMLNVSQAKNVSSLAQRTGTGTLKAVDGVDDDDLATKGQMDTAIETAVDGKLDKVTETTSDDMVYVKKADGTQTQYACTQWIHNGGIVRYSDSGIVKVQPGTTDYDAVNKKQMDTADTTTLNSAKTYTDTAIATAITTALNTEV